MNEMPLALTFDDVNIIPKYSEVVSRKDCDVSTWLGPYKFDIPLVSSPMDTVTGHDMAKRMHELGGLGIIHRFCSIEEQVAMVPDVDTSRIPLGAAVGIRNDTSPTFLERAEALVDAGVTILLVDVAHGHTKRTGDAIVELRKLVGSDITIIGGSVATYVGTQFLGHHSADAIRVGIGNGSLCETRIRTGVGVPQITALTECTIGGSQVIADGGMRTPGDVAKAFACGASMAMFGSLFAGTDEAPGEIRRDGIWPNEQQFKTYRGSASRAAKASTGQEVRYVEGNTKIIPYKGPVDRIINDLIDGLRSAMSYVGAKDLHEFVKNSEFVRVTHAGQIEAQPHLLL